MKKILSIFVCLCLLVPCAFAEDLPRNVGETDPAYAWLYENSLTVAERFQWGLDCTWHSFLLSAANVPEQEMLDALAPLRMQDYTQPTSMTFVRADHLLPDETIEAWQAALKAEEEAKAARAALRSAELVNELAIVKLANAEEQILKAADEAVKAAEEAFRAAEEAAGLAEGDAVQPAKEIAEAAEEAFKAAEDAAQAVADLEKGEAFLAAKGAAQAAKKTSDMVKEAKKAADEAARAAAEEAEETPETENAAESAEKTGKKEKTPAEAAAEAAAARIEAAVSAADKASKAAEEAFKAEANAIQAAQTLADLRAGKLTPDVEDDADLEFSDAEALEDASTPPSGDGAETGSDADYWDLDWDSGLDGTGASSGDDWDLDWDWDDWDSGNGENSPGEPQPEKKKVWFIEEDPERDLYHCAPRVLNYNAGDTMFSAVSDALQVTGFYLREETLDSPHYAVMNYGGLYALLITYYPSGDGFVSVNAQVIYTRSADELIKP